MKTVNIRRRDLVPGTVIVNGCYIDADEWEEFIKFINWAELYTRKSSSKTMLAEVSNIVSKLTNENDNKGE